MSTPPPVREAVFDSLCKDDVSEVIKRAKGRAERGVSPEPVSIDGYALGISDDYRCKLVAALDEHPKLKRSGDGWVWRAES